MQMRGSRNANEATHLAAALCGDGDRISQPWSCRAAPWMIVGNDEKLLWDDDGKRVLFPPGKDSVVILDLADPENPRMAANLPLKNSVVGPPVMWRSTRPTRSRWSPIQSMSPKRAIPSRWDRQQGLRHRSQGRPAQARRNRDRRQAAVGLELQSAGDLALVANSADKSISVLAVKGTDLKVIDTIDMGDIVSHVTFTPDGKHALAAKFNAHKVALLDVNGDRSPTPSSICRLGNGPSTWRWRPAGGSRSAPIAAIQPARTAVSIR